MEEIRQKKLIEKEEREAEQIRIRQQEEETMKKAEK